MSMYAGFVMLVEGSTSCCWFVGLRRLPLPCPHPIVVVMFAIQPSSRQFPIDLVLLLFRELDTHVYVRLEL